MNRVDDGNSRVKTDGAGNQGTFISDRIDIVEH
jgi:hypothetical protein